METSAVNKAHYQHRQAEKHLRYRRYDEAIECHQKAAELLEEALQTVKVPRAVASLKLQQLYHFKQKDIVRSKKDLFEYLLKEPENRWKRMAHAFPNSEFDDNDGATLQLAIYKTMEETDSLLEILVRKQGSDSDSMRSDLSSADTDDRVLPIDTIDGESSSSNNNTPMGSKHPKDEKTVIEELKTLNVQLKNLVSQLVTQLDASSKESESLRSRVKYLESERLKQVDLTQEHNEQARHNNLKVVTDSSGGTSPYVVSPMSEFSPDVLEPRSLPNLTPLELPTFDFSALTKQINKS